MTTRELLHDLVERLPETELDAARRHLEELVDPVLRALRRAPLDDEPESEAERAAVDAARRSLAAGRGTSHAEVCRRLLGER
ncbi:MAG: hypothetical protein HY329_02525 [Chloroflexi bacterium]|nr:hypothetical protein [Chloroflexota bacterium]